MHAPEPIAGSSALRAVDVRVDDRPASPADAKLVADMLEGKLRADRVTVELAVLEREDDIYERSLAQDGCAALGMVGVPAGQILDRERVRADVAIERAGVVHRGRGEADEYGSVYAHAHRRALARALDRALARSVD